MNPRRSRRLGRTFLAGSISGTLLLALVSCGQPDPSLSAQPAPETLVGAPGIPTVLEEVTGAPAATPTLTGPEADATIAALDAQQPHDLATVEAGGVLPTPLGGETPIDLAPPTNRGSRSVWGSPVIARIPIPRLPMLAVGRARSMGRTCSLTLARSRRIISRAWCASLPVPSISRIKATLCSTRRRGGRA